MRITPITGDTASSFSLNFIILIYLFDLTPLMRLSVDETNYFLIIYNIIVVILSRTI